jgi:F0F1-type ATP synthase membrane subunit c/vacuolar-type H+-ATPase subunit K
MILACLAAVGRRLALIAIALALTLAARPDGLHEGRLCTAAIRAAERTFDLPAGLLMAVALTETGRRIGDALTPWPWSINAAGEGAWLEHRSAAIERTRQLQARGIESIDVGCMQVNLKWHDGAFDSLEAAFDPRANVAYAARHLKELRAQSRDWLEAAGRYHSADPARARAYLARLSGNWQVVREGLGGDRALLPPAPGQIAPGLEWVSSDGVGPLVDLGGPRQEPLIGAARRPPLGLMSVPDGRHAAP